MRVYKKERNTELHYHDLLGLKVIFAVFEISKTPSKREKLMQGKQILAQMDVMLAKTHEISAATHIFF